MDLVCFLISRTTTDTWRVVRPDNCNVGLVATLELETARGDMHIYNSYNHLTQIYIDELLNWATSKSCDILMGDSNQHAELWGGPNVRGYCPKGRRLERGILDAGMKFQLAQGVVIYSRGVEIGADSCKSTIDIVFTGEAISDLVLSCEVVSDIAGFESHHRVIRLEVGLNSKRKMDKRQQWSEVNRAQYVEALRKVGKAHCTLHERGY